MKFLYHPAITAFGATTIFLLILLAPLASLTHTEFYHLPGPVSVILFPVLLNFAGLWLLLTLLLAWGRKHPWLDTCIWTILAITLPWMLIKAWFSLRVEPVPRIAKAIFPVVLLIAAAAMLVWRSHARKHAKRLGGMLLGFVAISGAVMLAEALWFGWQARELNAPRPLHQAVAVAAKPGRILWIVLDEISYRQVYEHRYPDLQMPAFDQLAAQATVFTHAVPVGTMTEIVLPTLLTGIPIDKVAAPAAGWPLRLRDSTTRTWQQLDPHNTIFQDALNAGYTTAVAGWYNPYCRILPEVLDRCYWTSHLALPGGMFPGQTIGWNTEQWARRQLVSVTSRLHITPSLIDTSVDTALHQQDYKQLLAAGDQLLDDPSITFLLLHMPIPHPDGIYNRHTGTFATSSTSYIDNLALCDVYLAHVRQRLEKNDTWNSTTLVLMGDHSWRVQTNWAPLPEWTPEEQVASDGGKFDDRPAYIVKLPQQKTAARIDTPFAALRTRELFNQLFTGRITTPQQLKSWAQQGD